MIETLPFPVAYPLAAARDERLPVEKRLNNAVFTAYQAMRTTALLLLSEYLCSTEPASDRVKKSIVGLMLPHWKEWSQLTTELAKFFVRSRPGGAKPDCLAGESARCWLEEFSRQNAPPKGGTMEAFLDPVSRIQGQRQPWSPNGAFWDARNDRAHRLGVQGHDNEQDLTLLAALLPLLEFSLPRLFPAGGFRICRKVPKAEGADPGWDEAFVIDLEGPHTDLRFEPRLESAEWVDLFEGSPVLAVSDSRAVPLHPFFVALDAETSRHDIGAGGLLEPLYLLDGFTDRGVQLFGLHSGGRKEKGLVEPLRRSLARKNVDLGIDRDRTKRWTIGGHAIETARQLLEDLRGTKYFPDWYVSRPDVDESFLARLLRPGGEHSRAVAVLVLGEAGSGKSSLLARFVDSLVNEGAGQADPDLLGKERDKDVVLYLSGRKSYVGESSESGASRLVRSVALQAGIRSGQFHSLADLLDHIQSTAKEDEAKERRVFLVLDALNEADRFRDLVAALDEVLGQIRSWPWLRLVVSMRSGAYFSLARRVRDLGAAGGEVFTNEDRFESFQGRSKSATFPERGREKPDNPYLEVRPFGLEGEAPQAYRLRQTRGRRSSSAAWELLPQTAKTILLNPLHLHLFHETFAGEKEIPSGLQEGALFRAYLESQGAEWPGLLDILSRLGETMLENRRAFLPVSIAEAWRDEYVKRNGLAGADQLAWLSPAELLVSASVLLRPLEDASASASEETLAGYSFCHQALAEAVLVNTIEMRLEKSTGSRIPSPQDLLRWARVAAGEVEGTTGAFEELVGAVGALAVNAVERGDGESVGTILDLESGQVRNRLVGSALEAWTRIRGNAHESGVLAGRFWAEFREHSASSVSRSGRLNDAAWEVQERASNDGSSHAAREIGVFILETLRGLVLVTPTRFDWRHDLPISMGRLSNLFLFAGETAEARALVEESISILRDLVAAEPSRLDWRRDLSFHMNGLSDLFRFAGDPTAAQALVEESISIMRVLVAAEPSRLDWRHNLTLPMERLSDLLSFAGQHAAARTLTAESASIMRDLVAADPSRLDWRSALSISLERLSEFFLSSGETASARALLKESLSINRVLVASDPSRLDWRHHLTSLMTRLSDLLRFAGETATARALVEESLSIQRDLVAAEPSWLDWRRDLAISMHVLSDLLQSVGETATARALVEESLPILRDLVAADPSHLDWRRDLAASMSRLSDLLRSAGETAAARSLVEESLSIMRDLVAAEPTRLDRRHRLAISMEKLTDLLVFAGQHATARALVEESLSIMRELVAAEPSRLDWSQDLTVSMLRLSDLLRSAGQTAAARSLVEECLSVMRDHVAAEPSRLDWRRDLTVALERLSDMLLSAGETAKSRALVEESLSIRRDLVAAEPSRLDWSQDLTASMLRLSDLLRSAGETAAALSLVEESLSIMRDHVAAEPSRLDWRRDLTVALERLSDMLLSAGETAKSRALVEESLSIRRDLVAAELSRLDWRRDLSLSLFSVSKVRRQSDDLAGAVEAALENLQLSRDLVDAQQDSLPSLKDLLSSLTNSTLLLRDSGNEEEARALERESIQVRRKLFALGGGTPEEMMKQVDLLQKHAIEALLAGRLAEAYRLRTEEVELRTALARDEGRRWETDKPLLQALGHMGTFAMDFGHLDQAADTLSRAERGTAFSRKAYPGSEADEFWEAIRNRLGKLALLKGDADGAAKIFAEVLERRRRVLARARKDERQSYGVAVSMGFLSRARFAQGRKDEALALAKDALSRISRIATGTRASDGSQLEVASALLLLHTLGEKPELRDRARDILVRYAEKGDRNDKFWRLIKEAGVSGFLPEEEEAL